MLYLSVIIGATLLLGALGFAFGGVYTLPVLGRELLFASLTTLAAFVIDGVAAFVARRLPERWFMPEVKVFSVSKREKELYRKLGVNKWKDYVPELGCFTGFHKDRLEKPSDSEYLARFLMESNYGVVGHVAGAILGFFVILLPFDHPLSVGLPVAVINMILSLLPTAILRYHTPSLRNLYQRSLRREKQDTASAQK